MYLTTNPKAIPHKPCSSVKQTTHTIGPSAKKILRKICNNKCKTFYKLLSNHEKKLVHGPIIQVNLTEKIPITEMEMKIIPGTPKTYIINTKTSATWTIMTAHWATTCANMTSVAVTPATQLRSRRPSFLSKMKDKAVKKYTYIFLVKKIKSNTIPRLKWFCIAWFFLHA